MSVCKFKAADIPLPEVKPPKEYPVHIDTDKGIVSYPLQDVIKRISMK